MSTHNINAISRTLCPLWISWSCQSWYKVPCLGPTSYLTWGCQGSETIPSWYLFQTDNLWTRACLPLPSGLTCPPNKIYQRTHHALLHPPPSATQSAPWGNQANTNPQIQYPHAKLNQDQGRQTSPLNNMICIALVVWAVILFGLCYFGYTIPICIFSHYICLAGLANLSTHIW